MTDYQAAAYHHCGPRKAHWWSRLHENDRYTCSCGRTWEVRSQSHDEPCTGYGDLPGTYTTVWELVWVEVSV